MRLSGSVYSKILDMDTGLTIVTPNKLREGKYKVVTCCTAFAETTAHGWITQCYPPTQRRAILFM